MRKEITDNDGWMDGLPRQTTFSSIKRMFGEYAYVSATRFQIGKGNDDSSIIV